MYPIGGSNPTLKESRLQATGHFDPEEAHLGKRFEISFDFVQLEDMTVVDGKALVHGRDPKMRSCGSTLRVFLR